MLAAMARNLPSLNALTALEAAARHGSIARAAAELHVTAATVSQHVRGLEEQLGIALFVRAARGVTLTAAARGLLPTLTDALDRIDDAARRLREGSARGRLVVSALPFFAAGWLVPRLPELERALPGVALSLRASRRLVDFDREEVDVAIRYQRAPPPALAAKRLFGELVFPVCSPALAYGPRPIESLTGLLQHPLLHDLDADPHQPWLSFPRWLERAGVPLGDAPAGLQLDDSLVIVAAAVAGRGVALGREPLVADQLARGLLCRPLPDAWESPWSYFAVAPKRAFRRPLVRAFVDWVASAPPLSAG
jgi:LysR family transcriptional regulator, glycine cleavage system transcriptional activator